MGGKCICEKDRRHIYRMAIQQKLVPKSFQGEKKLGGKRKKKSLF
jgi:hypothetical protein